MFAQTPSPSRGRSASFRTQDSNAARAAAGGLLLIPERFTALGYVPALARANGRQFFADYSSMGIQTGNMLQ